MALAGHKLDLFVLGADPLIDYTEHLRHLHGLLVREGVISADGRPEHPDTVVVGGVNRVRLDASERPRFYSNTKGGFRAFCGQCQHNITGPFASAVTRWREGGRAEQDARSSRLTCPKCGVDTPLTRTECMPPAAFGWGSLVLHDASSTRLTESFQSFLNEHLPNCRVVGSRA